MQHDALVCLFLLAVLLGVFWLTLVVHNSVCGLTTRDQAFMHIPAV